MSEMIKRVSDAIRLEFMRQRVDPTGISSLSGVVPPLDWSEIARAAITEMRTPTVAMKILDESLEPFWDNSIPPPRLVTPLRSHTGASWEQMIDEALK